MSTTRKISSNQENERRRSFDEKNWESISKFKFRSNTDKLRNGENSDILGVYYEASTKRKDEGRRSTIGIGRRDQKLYHPEMSIRRHTIEGIETSHPNISDVKDQSIIYGNMALEMDIIQSELSQLQSTILLQLRLTIGCEIANILFVTERSQKLLLYIDGKWLRVPIQSSLAGYCALSGETLSIPDAYADSRFNREVDGVTGFRTRDVLCHPVRQYKDSGPVVAVVQMLNKISPGEFDQQDQIVLEACVRRLSSDLCTTYKDLLRFADHFTSFEHFVNSHYQDILTDRKITDSTTASRLRHSGENVLTQAELISKMDNFGRYGRPIEGSDTGSGNGASRGKSGIWSAAKEQLRRRLDYGKKVTPVVYDDRTLATEIPSHSRREEASRNRSDSIRTSTEYSECVATINEEKTILLRMRFKPSEFLSPKRNNRGMKQLMNPVKILATNTDV